MQGDPCPKCCQRHPSESETGEYPGSAAPSTFCPATPTLTLTHYENGPMKVAIASEATWWMRKRQWYCPDDEELGIFEDEDFNETREQIEALLKADRSPSPTEGDGNG